jgi:AAA domain
MMPATDPAADLAPDGFPSDLLRQPAAARLAYFKEYTVAHPALRAADEALSRALREPAGASLLFLVGPTGVGKTTLRRRLEQRLIAEAWTTLDQDRERLPVAGLEAVAPDSGTFRWRDYYLRALAALEVPFLGHTLLAVAAAETGTETGGPAVSPGPPALARRLPTAELRRALELALRRRRPAAFLIDEAHHLARLASGRKLRDQLDCLKSLAALTDTVHVLVGTYELLVFRDLSAQLCRRSVDIHLPRYRADLADERRAFQSTLWAFQRQLPLATEPDLLGSWEYCYERSLGCIGILKDWLTRCLAAILEDDRAAWSMTHLQRTALTAAQCTKMAAEAREGEAQWADRDGNPARLRTLLGLVAATGSDPEATPRSDGSSLVAADPSGQPATAPSRSPSRRRVGERRPTRDRVGVPEGVPAHGG